MGSLGLTWRCWSRSESIGQYAKARGKDFAQKLLGHSSETMTLKYLNTRGEGGRHAAKDRISKFE
ncbi:hypothetical protein DMW62_04130 [Serratia marcescens]|uniref:Tyr recombinase domain-containing protein n=1 Tax=Serratia marcescens TaxID=615 RepID=A0ABX5NH62_SERMA|nr:hypothetical protein CW300_21485 [Serratia marcescens]PYA12728.1 hypothetical protein DMW42_20895 [Serratia marcescens]PYA21290.1 hypothetical protein DMW41_20205 [Serratia marcescens]PYA24134.1 hypothetical protein DMW40_21270 [Serratia marcescens]PYA35709.1 hypothetical protein DMW44_22140 [Serratia marcescens]